MTDQPEPFPYVDPPEDRLYRVGHCRECGISLWSYTPKARELCGGCDEAQTKDQEAA